MLSVSFVVHGVRTQNLMSQFRIYPYKITASAKRLLHSLEAKWVGAYDVIPRGMQVINWGCSFTPPWWTFDDLNSPPAVANAVNKLKTFCDLVQAEINIPSFGPDSAIAKRWLADGKIVVGRQKLEGHGGDGIVIMKKLEDFVECKLYTQHLRHKIEFRVHIVKDKVIDVTEKRKKRGVDADILIRNRQTGWVYCRDGMVVPDGVTEQALKAVKALGLDFGAVDVAYRERENNAYVLEVNTAPGLEGTTLLRYKEAFNALLGV